MKRHILGLGTLAALAVLAASPAAASQPNDSYALTAEPAYHMSAVNVLAATKRSEFIRFAQSAVSASEAKAIARRTVPGSVYVDMSRKGDVYKVRVKKDGRIVDVLIDANTGRVLN
jgi:uncharacterized membrane protein YkoI